MPTIELSLTEIMFGRSTGGKTVIRIIKTIKQETKGGKIHDLWILLDGSKLFLGVKIDRFYQTVAYTTFEELGSLNFFLDFLQLRRPAGLLKMVYHSILLNNSLWSMP